ncbi:MAG: Mur ligase family protein [Microthrixaceae bacterium]|nr:Mur ligase family protein [Microthrixaceae bacterium]
MPDVQVAVSGIARLARSRLEGPVIGVTGSVGKTTTKDLLAAVLETTTVTASSHRSFNNELGVPITLANAPERTRATVVEMGARGTGHIEFLCSMAKPTVGVVTTVHAVHTEVMGDEDRIARTKAELIEHLPADGLAVLNADDDRVAAMAGLTGAGVLTFRDGFRGRCPGVRSGGHRGSPYPIHHQVSLGGIWRCTSAPVGCTTWGTPRRRRRSVCGRVFHPKQSPKGSPRRSAPPGAWSSTRPPRACSSSTARTMRGRHP